MRDVVIQLIQTHSSYRQRKICIITFGNESKKLINNFKLQQKVKKYPKRYSSIVAYFEGHDEKVP